VSTFTAADVHGVAEDCVAHLDEPIGDAACLPTFLLAREAARALEVVLTGEGADELFAGYDYYRSYPALRALRHAVARRLALLRGRPAPPGRSPLSGFGYALASADRTVAPRPAARRRSNARPRRSKRPASRTT
jgi:asparagine synthase (glutamine-hydrolysing)